MKFQLGELAIVVSATALPERIGQIVTIIQIAPRDGLLIFFFHNMQPPDYKVQFMDGKKVCCWEHNLKKIPPREEPESITRREECEA